MTLEKSQEIKGLESQLKILSGRAKAKKKSSFRLKKSTTKW